MALGTVIWIFCVARLDIDYIQNYNILVNFKYAKIYTLYFLSVAFFYRWRRRVSKNCRDANYFQIGSWLLLVLIPTQIVVDQGFVHSENAETILFPHLFFRISWSWACGLSVCAGQLLWVYVWHWPSNFWIFHFIIFFYNFLFIYNFVLCVCLFFIR